MSLLDSSWFTDRPIHPDKQPKKIPMTEWEYQEKHGLDSQKDIDSDFSDPSAFSFSSDQSMDSDGPAPPKKERPLLNTSDPEKIGEALKTDLDFISTSHNLSTQRREAADREIQDTISSAKYTYFNDLEAEAQFSDLSFSDDFESSSKSKTNKYGISDALESELMTCGVQKVGKGDSSCIVRKSQSAKIDSSSKNYDFDNSSSKISKISTLKTTDKSTKTDKNTDTISTMADISSFHDTMTSDFKLESTQGKTKTDTDKISPNKRKSVTITDTLQSTLEKAKSNKDTKEFTDFSSDTDLLATNRTSTLGTTDLQTNTQTMGDSLMKSNTITKKTTISCKTDTSTIKPDPNASSLYGRINSSLEISDQNNKLAKEKYKKQLEEENSPYKKMKKEPIPDQIPEFMKDERRELIERRKEESLQRQKESLRRSEDISKQLEESVRKHEMTDERRKALEYKPKPLEDKSPRFPKEDRTSLKSKRLEEEEKKRASKQSSKKKYELIPDESDLIKERKLKKLIGEQKLEEIGEKVPPPPPKEKHRKRVVIDEDDVDPRRLNMSEKDKKAFYDPATTKAAQLRNQMIRQKIVQQAEADRAKREEEDERLRKEIKVAARIEPDLRKLREQSQVKTKDIKERRKEEEEKSKQVSKETRKMLKRVEKNPSLFNREGQELTRQEARHRAKVSSVVKTQEQMHWDTVRARREAKNEELRKMWSGKM
ncbi:hypothetical protein TVAGG3_0821770 [Trichomonas vaginalis G3]|uniref:hypothetical protein n=1 Tax=Trichomonas vaginalis (strain ATCC PRA-98 / G3) TaxID=412133 RepID=UPI0021E5BD32|nr:hypothetical protein TVAGG3_0821770 [Trichomonas vaginalis G3]KAI5497945.1 hypothetical protein TVAGG3_0821770 [Trichomonas vaginalis G3]